MGAYLSEPDLRKTSKDESDDFLICGSSSMQGWRMTQEDSHNCILNFDNNAAYFAVYDGHGGAEVALYSSESLPGFLKLTEEYKNRNFEEALKQAFIGFDATLLEASVIKALKKFMVANGDSEAEDLDEPDEEDDLTKLCQEGNMPLNEVLEKYKDDKRIPIALAMLKAGESSKPISPYLRGRRNCASNDDNDAYADGPSSSGSGSSGSGGASGSARRKIEPNIRDTEEDGGVSSSSAAAKLQADDIGVQGKVATNGPSSSSSEVNSIKAISIDAPDSSSTQPIDNSEAVKSTNGEHKTEPEVTTNSNLKSENVSSSSSASSTTNGDLSSTTSSSQGEKKALNSSISSTNAAISSAAPITKENLPATVHGNRPVRAAVPVDDELSTTEDEEDESYNAERSSSDDGEAMEDSDDEDEEGEEDTDEEEDDMYPDDEESNAFLNNMVEGPASSSGCTAVVALLVDKELFVANAGDSRCVVCRSGKALEMSVDHKPEDPEELERILNAGGRVTSDGRVNGGLNLSRALGDHAYKMNKPLKPEEQMISAMPDIKKLSITSDDDFMVIACDGIWNFMTSEEVVEFVKLRLTNGIEKMSTICEELFMNCLATNTSGDGTGCDNMTAIIVKFKHESSPFNDTTTTTAATTKKRSASPVPSLEDNVDGEATTTTNHKRIKTDDGENKAPMVIDVSGGEALPVEEEKST